MCNKHEHKLKIAQKELELSEQQSMSGAATGFVMPTSLASVSPLRNGISPTPPSTPESSKMSLMDRIKSKFTRVQNCATEDLIVNVEDDIDPYAFPESDVTTNSAAVNSEALAVSCTNSHQGSISTSQGARQLMSGDQLSDKTHTSQQMLSPDWASNVANSVCAGLPPTPPSGETPIAKMYPELLGKLHSQPAPPSSVGERGAHTTQLNIDIPNHVLYAFDDNGLEAPLMRPAIGQFSAKSQPKSGKGSSRGAAKVRKGTAVLESSSSKCVPIGGSTHSSRTMNKLQNKIAQNKIQSKIRSRAKRQHKQPSSAESGRTVSSQLLAPAPPPASHTGLSSSVTSTVFSLGSIPSLGTFLNAQQQQQQHDSGIDLQSADGSYVGSTTHTGLNVTLPVFTNNVVLSPPSADPSAASTVPLVMPATVFTPFPNLADALNNLHNKDLHLDTASQLSTIATGKVLQNTVRAESRKTSSKVVSKQGLKLTIKKNSVKKKKLRKTKRISDDGHNRPTVAGALPTSPDVKQVSSGVAIAGHTATAIHTSSPIANVLSDMPLLKKPRKRPLSKKALSTLRPKSLALTASSNDGRPGVVNITTAATSTSTPRKYTKKITTTAKTLGASRPTAKHTNSSCQKAHPQTEGSVTLTSQSDLAVAEAGAGTARRLKRASRGGLLDERTVLKKYRRHTAWSYYNAWSELKRRNGNLLSLGKFIVRCLVMLPTTVTLAISIQLVVVEVVITLLVSIQVWIPQHLTMTMMIGQ